MMGHKIFEPKRLYAFSLENRVPADHSAALLASVPPARIQGSVRIVPVLAASDPCHILATSHCHRQLLRA